MTYRVADKGYDGGRKATCPICGDEFVTRTRHNIYCIKISCWEAARRMRCEKYKAIKQAPQTS